MVTRHRLATICARGGSVGVPGKNVRLLNGRPLVAHSVTHALESGLFDCVAVSSDSSEVLDAAAAAGAQELVRRPDVLAHDRAAKLPAIHHAAETVEAARSVRYDVVVDLDATSPLRTVEDVREAVRLLEASGATNVFSVTSARRSPWFNMVVIDDAGGPSLVVGSGVHRRQDAPAAFDLNASIYAWTRQALAEGKLIVRSARVYVMPPERSFDIDDETDWFLVEALAARRPDLGGVC